MSTTMSFDVAALAGAIERDDPAGQAAAYATDAVVEIQNRDRGPADPLVLRGREAIRAMLDDVASRKLEHRVRRAVSDGAAGAIHVACRYPDGTGVTCMSSFDVEGGVIVRETRLETWDG